MTRADLLLVNDIRNIFANGTKDENPRPKYEDGTPAYTYFVNHVVRTYNLQTEFPITSLRPQAWKTGIKEMMAIYQNQSNKVLEFERYGCGWWKDWTLEDGTIGKAYPYNFESHRPNEMKRTIVKITRRIVDEKYKKPIMKSFEMLDSIDNIIYCNRYKIISLNNDMSDGVHKFYTIQFLSNGYTTYMRSDLIGKSNGINPYDRTVFNIGYLGDYQSVKNFTENEIHILQNKWRDMLRRCYFNPYKNNNPTYNKIFVHQDWHCFETFLRDVRYLPQYFLAREDNFEGWDLDKDYYGSNAYSKNTCVFLKKSENIIYSNTNKMYEITNIESGEKYYELTLIDMGKIFNVDRRTIAKHLNDDEYKGFNIKVYENTKEYVYRYELSRNQVVELIKNIQSNPYSRRHIISFWHWANIDKKSLVECAYETIWNVRGEYLDMCLIQRSGDMITASGAGGVNEVQYACLQMMIAKATGYKAGKFTHFVANEQIYDRHIYAANELINRANAQKLDLSTSNGHYDYEFEPVKMNFNPKSDNFYDFSIEDFSLENYNPIKPNLKLELGI